ncbi:hypothetical protein H6G81_33445 [Scytonema hofmannii FACHB-248]|uniref:Uncharacterized protein n=1 Tax=Scytonema hofmannii FACHB-248 TaxID=1842502 RepID=A0ABR8H217_9CYAN|nr:MULTISPECIES: hypothetical protein [Nostocales]MBD2609280.1 hypothetical protein [Scytonema hofmannii FACHB-248]
MAITIEQTLLNNQSILEKIALVEEIDEQAAEIISGGQSGNDIPIDPNENPDDQPPKKQGNMAVPQAYFAFDLGQY